MAKTLHQIIENIITNKIQESQGSPESVDPEVLKTLTDNGLKYHHTNKHDPEEHTYVHSVNHHIRANVKGKNWHSILKNSTHKGSGHQELQNHYSNTLKFHKLKKEINPLSEATIPESLQADNTSFKYPPPFLTMKRKAVRAFPDGQHVAVYFISQLNRFISIPFGTNKKNDQFDLPAVSENLDEATKPKKKAKIKVKPYDFFKHLKDIAKGGEDKNKPLRFASGERLKMQPEMAQLILHAHSKLNPMNQAKAHKAMRTNKNLFGRFHTYSLGVATVTK